MDKSPKILISRTDNIGDVIFATPMATLLKKKFPQCDITFLVKNYTQSILAYFKYIDHSLTLEELEALPFEKAAEQIARYNFDIFINVFPIPWTAKLAKAANIPTRIGTSRRLHHWLYCNRLVNLSRKKSEIHATQMNTKLLEPEPLGLKTQLVLEDIPIAACIPSEKKRCLPTSPLTGDTFKLIIHPGSNGNGREWPIDHYIELIKRLAPNRYSLYITGSKEEEKRFSKIKAEAPPHAHFRMGTMELKEFCLLIASVDGLVASGTGPLHFAGALGIRTLGLFPLHPTFGATRWKPLGKAAEYLVKEGVCQKKCRDNDCPCMRAISVDRVLNKINTWERIKKR